MGRGLGRRGAFILMNVSAAFAALLVGCSGLNPIATRGPTAPSRIIPVNPTIAPRPTSTLVPITPSITPLPTPTIISLLPIFPSRPTPTPIPLIPNLPPRPTQKKPPTLVPQKSAGTGIPTRVKPLAPSTRVTQISKEIGSNGDQGTEAFRVGGADLGSVFDWNGKTYMIFGDTFSSFEVVPPSGFRQNTMAFSSDSDFSDGLDFDGWITDERGYAKQLFSSGTVSNKHAIPTHGVAIGSTGYIYYQQIARRPGAGNWDVELSSVYKSTDNGDTWSRVSALTWAGSSNFAQVTFYKQGGYIYAFGIPAGRRGGVTLMRVAEEHFEDRSQYEYLADQAGAGNWVPNVESAAVTIVPSPVGELSIAYNEFLQQYIMLYLNPGSPSKLVFRTSPRLIGPWSRKQVLASSVQFPFMYAPFTKEDFIEQSGKIMYFRLSRNDHSDFKPYSTYWMKLEFSLP